MDQTKFFVVGEYIRVHDNKTVDNPMKPKDIDDCHHITKVALRSKASNNSNITWMEYENNTFPIKSKRVLVPELLAYSREDRLPNRLIQIQIQIQNTFIASYT